jgi:hypothetical protein
MVTVRLAVNADGSGQITSAVVSLKSTGQFARVERAKGSVSAADVGKLMQLVEKAGFWSMHSTEPKSNGDTGRKVYVLDPTDWVVEAVRSGSFHYVFRQGPAPTPITEIGRYLAKDLAKLDDSIISIDKYIPPSQ